MKWFDRRVFDVVVAAGLAVIALVEALLSTGYPPVLEGVTAVLLAVPLGWRRTHATAALAGVLVVLCTQTLAFGTLWDAGSALAIPLVAVYSVAAYTPLWHAVSAYAVAVATISIADLPDDGGSDWAFIGLVFGAVWVAGLAVRRQRLLVDQVTEYAALLEAAHAEREATALREERTRIAREMHDVVAHCVSTMVVQAEAGESLLHRSPARAADAFVAVQTSGRQALEQLRRMLGLLREDQGEADTLVPQPGLGDLEALLDSVRETGLALDVVTTGRPRELPPELDLSAYRIVQEALTNILRHADATRATVSLSWAAESLEIEVTDNGRGAASDPGPAGGGHGLLGMRERARMHGGTLEIDRAEGFVVRTRLPIP